MSTFRFENSSSENYDDPYRESGASPKPFSHPEDHFFWTRPDSSERIYGLVWLQYYQ
jgi:hypothetical protein